MKKSPKRNQGQQSFPHDGFVRANQIIGNPEKGIAPFFPVSRSQWFLGIKQGIYPPGIKLSKRVTVWRAEDIRNLLHDLSQENS